jgi:hypothetical protein
MQNTHDSGKLTNAPILAHLFCDKSAFEHGHLIIIFSSLVKILITLSSSYLYLYLE